MDRADRAASATLDSLSRALSHNLRLHARKYESISALCSASDVNRQQFNKYLTGETLPSLLNLTKIANVLGVTADELLIAPTIRVEPQANPIVELEKFVKKENVEIRTGYYLDYTYYSVFVGNILVAIVKIEKSGKNYTCRTKLIFRSRGHGTTRYFRYKGVAFASKEAVYLSYAHENNPADLVFCLLQPDVRYSADMIGIRTAMSNSSPSIPFSASFYFRYLGEQPNLRDAVQQCGLFRLDDLNEQQSRILARLAAKTQTAQNIIRISHI
jgi:transcriptional regulator with XRE-family HTH domain